MKKMLIIFSLMAILPCQATELAGLNAAEQQALESQVVAHYRHMTKQLGGTLLKTLQTTMQTEGAVNAIAVCREQAPVIAKGIAEENHLSIKRVSLKNRNPHNGLSADTQEASVLQNFAERQAKGEDLTQVDKLTVIDVNGQPYYQFMKAIPTGTVCLTCHGANVDAALYSKIKEYYPDDKAIGFKEGELRGAFVITQAVSEAAALYKAGKLQPVTPTETQK
ncbi:Protein of unknown function (DUF3365) [Beggiatoa alba B18LD]|uniref:Tll0287-like domain-containing protein n=1 Tax=Beggiatoa alba B18LD TaxID=395493 RepID=I3CKK3_9GAMM|nr:DUF3365 domain-containing protein [Beggiatoa alba]EIJ44146.1 Protein of unknown function (DUF3365) [Beggiatoa alba B18LD]